MEPIRPDLPSWFIASDPKSFELVGRAASHAGLRTPVLISGECGSGRHTLARLLHSWSPGTPGDFITISATRPVEEWPYPADGSTLYFPDAYALAEPSRARLLELIGRCGQNGNARVMVSTQPGMPLAAGQVLPNTLEVPPLRERPGDLGPLAAALVGRLAERLGRAPVTISEPALQVLRQHRWPGNAIELEAVLVRALLAARVSIEPEHLALEAAFVPARLAVLERAAIERTLLATQGNRTHAARSLGISVRTLQYRLKEYGIHWEGYAETKARVAAGLL
jgi:DNA-binding NtrC family response regulator